MMLTALLAALPLFGGPQIEWAAPALCVSGEPYRVHVSITAPKDGAVVANWLLTPSAFTLDGKALAKREEGGAVTLPAGFKLEGDIDLGPYIQAKGDFRIDYAGELDKADPVPVTWLESAPKLLDFMKLPLEELANYRVLLQTSRGPILLKFWPEIAPNHVRNFLDLSYAGFYNQKTFHRVIPGFMIQGGDPKGDGTGDGPRTVKREFTKVHIVSLGDAGPNAGVKVGDELGFEQLAPIVQLNESLMRQRKRPIEFRGVRSHTPGVLSMARTSPDSASCQFFICHGDAWMLDGQYACFGETVLGLDVVDGIVNAQRDRNDKPLEPQLIERALVVKAPAK